MAPGEARRWWWKLPPTFLEGSQLPTPLRAGEGGLCFWKDGTMGRRGWGSLLSRLNLAWSYLCLLGDQPPTAPGKELICQFQTRGWGGPAQQSWKGGAGYGIRVAEGTIH